MFASIVRAARGSPRRGATAPVAPRLLSQTGLYSNAATLKIDARNRRSRRSIRSGATARASGAGCGCRTDRRSTSPTWRSGSCRSARDSGRSFRSRAARSRRGSCGERARTVGCLRPMRGTTRRPTPSSLRRRHRQHRGNRERQAPQHSVGLRVPLVPRLEPHRDARLQRAAAVDRSRSERVACRAAVARHDHVADARRREPDRAAARGARHEPSANRRELADHANGARISLDELRQLPQSRQLDRVARLTETSARQTVEPRARMQRRECTPHWPPRGSADIGLFPKRRRNRASSIQGIRNRARLIRRVKSRRPISQMPPIGTVVADSEAVDLLTSWVQNNPDEWRDIVARCGVKS